MTAEESPGWMFEGGIAWRLERGRLAGEEAGGPGVPKVRVSTLRPGSARGGLVLARALGAGTDAGHECGQGGARRGAPAGQCQRPLLRGHRESEVSWLAWLSG